MHPDPDAFERLVAEAMDAIPEPFASALDEVAVVVEDEAPREMGRLYGLYQGVPLIFGQGFSGQMPARIAIYRGPLTHDFRDDAALREQVRITVLHELGHHLGMDEDDLDRLGYG